jgi:hypothetical protein
VSCWAVGRCAVVGEQSIDDDSYNVAMLWDGATYHDQNSLDPWSVPQTGGTHRPETDRPVLSAFDAGVDCVPDGSCMVVDDDGIYAWWDGADWTTHRFPVSLPLSCTTATHCVAGGLGGHVWDGTDWSAGLPLGPSGYQAFTLDCADADWCLSGGGLAPPLPGVPAASVGDGTAWQELAVPLLGEGAFVDLSCQADRRCLALSYHLGGTEGMRALAWNGDRWYPVSGPDDVVVPAGSTTLPFGYYTAIDCVEERCLAVGWREAGAGVVPISAVYDWSGLPG